MQDAATAFHIVANILFFTGGLVFFVAGYGFHRRARANFVASEFILSKAQAMRVQGEAMLAEYRSMLDQAAHGHFPGVAEVKRWAPPEDGE